MIEHQLLCGNTRSLLLVSLFFFLFLFTLLLSFSLLLFLLLFVVLSDENQSVQCKDSSHHSTDVHSEHHVIVLGRKCLDELLRVKIGKIVYDFLNFA